jgi:hypothetical protein
MNVTASTRCIHHVRVPSRASTSSLSVLFHPRNALYGSTSNAYCPARLTRPFRLPTTITFNFAASSFSSNAAQFHNLHKNERSYRVLGISVSSSYEEVQRTFLQLALIHHPDKTGRNSVEEFIRYRKAFETIRAQVLANKQPNHENGNDEDDTAAEWTNEEMQDWFYEETGEFLSFQMDQNTIQEVIKAFTTLAPGGRDPGEWEMARQLTEREERRRAGGDDDDDDDDGPLLQLTGSMHSGTTIRRRQRRRR